MRRWLVIDRQTKAVVGVISEKSGVDINATAWVKRYEFLEITN